MRYNVYWISDDHKPDSAKGITMKAALGFVRWALLLGFEITGIIESDKDE